MRYLMNNLNSLAFFWPELLLSSTILIAILADLFYSKKDKIQKRINGKAHINNQNQLCEQKWKTMRNLSKLCYFQNHTP